MLVLKTMRSKIVEWSRKHRKNPTPAEAFLHKLIKQHVKPTLLKRQVIIGNLIIDLTIPHRNLLIQVDGSIHNRADIIAKDKRQDSFLTGIGFTVLRVTNDDVFKKSMYVVKTIKGFPETDALYYAYMDSLAVARESTKRR